MSMDSAHSKPASATPGEWQAIDTAPKDGTEIDVWVREFTVGDAGAVSVKDIGRIANALWSIERHYYLHGEPRIGTDKCWVSNEYGSNYEAIEPYGRRLTHWMPLPKAPGAKP